MKRSVMIGALTVACLGLVVSPLAADRALSKSPERASGGIDAQALRAEQARVHRDLVLERADRGLEDPLEVRLGKRELRRLTQRTPGERPYRVGAKKRLNVHLNFDRERQPFGASRVRGDGGTVWTGAVRSPGATALRLQLGDFHLPEGHELWIYSDAGQVRGPYTGRGPLGNGRFWTHTIFGDRAILQLRSPAEEEPAPRFTIVRAGHMGPKFTLPAYTREGAERFVETHFCNINESCVENAECGASNSVNDARGASAQILFPSQGGLFICSGGLIADTDTNTVRDLFLTANHCISRASEASGSESFFRFTTPCNHNGAPHACPDFNNGSYPSTVGAVILKTGKKADYTLMELSQSPSGFSGIAYLGWDSTPVAFTDGFQMFRISHPSGAPQAYSTHSVDTSAVTCGGWPRGQRIYSRDTFGATEGGSSGSPVVNAAGQVVGQLTGACGFNVGDVCDNVDNATVDGAFANYFSQVQDILDPGTSGGTCTPGPTPKGGTCTQDSDCQSCNCKGRTGSKTCK